MFVIIGMAIAAIPTAILAWCAWHLTKSLPAWLRLQITLALARDSVASGVDLVYVGVHADNARAIRMYDGLGFGVLGPRSSDMLLERPR